jgi:hypothetical protein
MGIGMPPHCRGMGMGIGWLPGTTGVPLGRAIDCDRAGRGAVAGPVLCAQTTSPRPITATSAAIAAYSADPDLDIHEILKPASRPAQPVASLISTGAIRNFHIMPLIAPQRPREPLSRASVGFSSDDNVDFDGRPSSQGRQR